MNNQKQSNKIYDVAILGGGAAGLAAAVTCALKTKANNEARSIAVLEATDRICKSILKTGNGRCNFSNMNIQQRGCTQYHNSSFVEKALISCQDKTKATKVFDKTGQFADMLAPYQMFNAMGLSCEVDSQGRMYPYTKKANSVVDVFRYTLSEIPVQIIQNFKVENLRVKEPYVLIEDKNGEIIKAKKVIVSIGGNKNLDIFKEHSNPYKPVLGPIKTDNKYTKNLDGIRVSAKVTLLNDNEELISEEGELLFRKYGLSGICIFNLSRYLVDNAHQKIRIDYFPQLEMPDLLQVLQERHKQYVGKENTIKVDRLLAGMLLSQISVNVAKIAKVDGGRLRYSDLNKIAWALKNYLVEAFEIADKKQCQVSRGGIDVKNIDANTMQFKDLPIYCVGEFIDVDGPCGGYNLHWAWTSGILAGLSV